jgi:chromate transport protein ChrA
MVGFHPINRTMTVGTFMFIGSMVIIALGALFYYLHYSSSLYLSLFFYGLGIFFLSAIILFIGTLLAAKSGKLQKRASDIWNNRKDKS